MIKMMLLMMMTKMWLCSRVVFGLCRSTSHDRNQTTTKTISEQDITRTPVMTKMKPLTGRYVTMTSQWQTSWLLRSSVYGCKVITVKICKITVDLKNRKNHGQITVLNASIYCLQIHYLTQIVCTIYEGRSKSFEPYPFKRKVDKWSYLYFSAYSPPLSVHSL